MFNQVTQIDNNIVVQNVLVSVFDKAGLDTIINGLLETCPGVKFYSTGGTAKAIQTIAGNERLVSVSDYTGQPEMQGGLVKTLDFKIYLGLLSETYNDAHRADLARVGAIEFDMVIANLYPFKTVVAQPDVTPELARTNIDIGGPCMIRASAKNYIRVASVTDPADYDSVISELRDTNGALSLATRFSLMRKAFAHTASYDTAIAAYFALETPQTISKTYNLE